MVKKRDTRFELLRIIAMFMIVLHHSIVHGVFMVEPEKLAQYPINTAVLSILESGGEDRGISIRTHNRLFHD